MREEGGTPAIVEAVRAGMAVQLKEAAAAAAQGFIGEREDALMRRVRARMADGRLGKNFVLLGNSQVRVMLWIKASSNFVLRWRLL